MGIGNVESEPLFEAVIGLVVVCGGAQVLMDVKDIAVTRALCITQIVNGPAIPTHSLEVFP